MGEFQSVLKRLRTSAELTQEELASKLGITRSRLGMYETGAREPDLELLEKIADFFNVDMDYLTGRTQKTTYVPESQGYYTNPETAKLAQRLLDDSNYRVLFDAAEDASPEDLQKAADFLRFLKGQN